MPTKEYRPRLAWFTVTPEDRDVYHTCWDCPMFIEIEEENLNVTIVKWAIEAERYLCKSCRTIEGSRECCESYPYSGSISVLTKAKVVLDYLS